jgi:hypothetical protein
MNTVDVANFFDNVSCGREISIQFKKSITPLSELNLKDQKILDEAQAWLNLYAVRAAYGSEYRKGVLISMTKISETYYVYEKTVNDEGKSAKGNTLVKDEIICNICRTYSNSASAMSAIIKSLKKYGPDWIHEFVKFS